MTSSNINKIMRSNITLKPWILSKNTSEIVNTCIQKIYKQSQNNFKNDTTKVATSKPENKAPIRALKSQERDRIPLSINVSRAKKGTVAAANATGKSGTGAGGASAAPAASAAAPTTTGTGERLASNAAANNRRSGVASLAANRRLLKSSPNYKIYSSRRFGSSASSSNASIFRRTDERRRSTTQTAQLNYLLRNFATQMNSRKPLTTILPKFMVAARNQHIEARTVNEMPTHMAQMASAIQRDLMPINSALKDRIALGRPRLNKAAAAQKAKNSDPMSGWHHPPSQQVFLTRVNQRGIASTELQEQYRHMKNVNRMRQFEHITQIENRHAILGSVGKKIGNTRMVDEVELDVGTNVPTRNQTPNFEQTYKTLLSHPQRAEIDPLVPPTSPPENISHITSAAPTTAKTAAMESNTASTSYVLMPTTTTTTTQHTTKKPSEESCVTPEIAAQSATAAALKPSEAEVSNSVPAQLMTISKKSATSQIVSRAAAAASQGHMRFNHSAHLKKF